MDLEVKKAQTDSRLSNLTLPNSTGETQQGMREKKAKPKEGAHIVTTQKRGEKQKYLDIHKRQYWNSYKEQGEKKINHT